ncbi:SWIM zinc finger family protein [Salegentibacter sp. JZCK2]|uniref:SWIM zinc finger family protein n=1 Tax=Salegentibacter tibetensis TaxID=2873600 RepID=UPI001CCB9B59|nr:SWIM zinc finger family protein [Salegentibacter tibetensis]MBZ9729672.1 SWIM zinc finger family protein [Salegentibacter tibetensis]
MLIPFESFENYIEEKILSRGFSYFEDSQVNNLVEIKPGNYEAQVLGSDEYCVKMVLEEGLIVKHSCDCPYDYGPVCKHMVAVLFAIRETSIKSMNVNEVSKVKNRKPLYQQVEEVLVKIPDVELRKFIQENCTKNQEFRNTFFASFSDLVECQNKDYFAKQIQSVLNSAAGRDGFIGWAEMPRMVRAMEPFLDHSQSFYNNSDFEKVFYFNTALLEEMTAAFEFGDDSNADIGYHIDFAENMLYQLANEDLPEELRITFFTYCLTSFQKKIYEGWNWHLSMLNIAKNLSKNEDEADEILKLLETVNGKYEIEEAQSIQLSILRQFKDEDEVADFIEHHLDNPAIKRSEIEKAVKHKNFKKAKEICKDGIEHNKIDKPGLVTEWYNWLLKIAQTMKDSEEIIKYARILFIDSFRNEQDYFEVLRAQIPREDWPGFVQDLLSEIKNQHGRVKNELLTKIYIKEAMWKELLSYLKINPYLQNLQYYEPYLATDYTPDLLKMYTEQISKYLSKNVGRNHYQTACGYLKRMKNLGGVAEADELIKNLREQYNNRPAFMDELNKI